MGLYDRDYVQDNFQQQGQYPRPPMRIGMPGTTTVVLRLIIINIVVFLFTSFFEVFFIKWFSVYPKGFHALEVWRLITYQFLHSGFWHLFFNMLILFFFGPMLEKIWGSRKFLTFYLGCGIAGGLFYLLLVAMNFLPAGVMVGASGAILGMLAACAILFPQFVVF